LYRIVLYRIVPYLLGVEAELGLDGLEVGTSQGRSVHSAGAGLAAALADHRADLWSRVQQDAVKEKEGYYKINIHCST
jgi:hypothetical protein